MSIDVKSENNSPLIQIDHDHPGDRDGWVYEEITLDPQQTKALEMMLTGRTDSDIAARVGVTRQTVNEWRNQNMAFMEALQSQRELLREIQMDRLNALVDEGLEALRGALHSDNENTRLKAAALVLRMAGLQEQAKHDIKARNDQQNPMEWLSRAIGQVAQELGFKDPTQPPPPRQLPEGKPDEE